MSASGVVIVGGAVMGSFSAWFLRQQGYSGRIRVIERDPGYAWSSTARSASGIRTQFGAPVNLALSLFAMDFMRNIRSHFGADADIGLHENGYLILATPAQAAEREAAVRWQRAAGADVVTLTPAQLRERFAWLNVDDLGLASFGQTGEGWFDAWSLLSLVRRAARQAGVEYLHDEAASLVLDGSRVTAVRLCSGAVLPCDWCVLAAGAASGQFVRPLGIALPVEPRKRTVFSFRAPVPSAGFPMLFDTSGLWVRPEGEGFIGGIQPPPDRDPPASGDFEPDHAMFEQPYWPLLAHRIPAMEALRLERSWAGHYEVNTLDHNGVIGPHDEIKNLVFATGFSGHGVMHSPAVGRAVAEWITQQRWVSIDVCALGWTRIRDGQPFVEQVVY